MMEEEITPTGKEKEKENEHTKAMTMVLKGTQRVDGVTIARAILMTLNPAIMELAEKETEKESEDYGRIGTTLQNRKVKLLLEHLKKRVQDQLHHSWKHKQFHLHLLLLVCTTVRLSESLGTVTTTPSPSRSIGWA